MLILITCYSCLIPSFCQLWKQEQEHYWGVSVLVGEEGEAHQIPEPQSLRDCMQQSHWMAPHPSQKQQWQLQLRLH